MQCNIGTRKEKYTNETQDNTKTEGHKNGYLIYDKAVCRAVGK